MRFLQCLFFFLCVLLAPAARTSAQDVIDQDDGALVDRVEKEIDALVQASEIARAKKEALEEIGASIREARQVVDAALPADPGEMTGLERLNEQSLHAQVELRETYLANYRNRKQQMERLPGLTDARRKMISQAMEAFRIYERHANDLRLLLTALAGRIESGRISQKDTILRDNGVEFWMDAVVQQQEECAAWIETYGVEATVPENQPAAETVWNLEKDRDLQQSFDVASIMFQTTRHEATEREDLENTDHAALPTLIARVHDNWRGAMAEYQRAWDRAEIKRAAIARLEATRRDLKPPSKKSISEGVGHSELQTARREAAYSDQLVRYDTRRWELTRQANEVANELMEELLAIPTAFERARRQAVTLKAALGLAKDWMHAGKIESFDFPEGANVAGLAASMLTIAQGESARRREVDELKQRINTKKLLVAAQHELEQEQEKNTRFHKALEEELSYATFLKEMAAKDEAALIALVEPEGTLSASIEKLAEAVDQARHDFDLAIQTIGGARDAIRTVENPYARRGFLAARERLAEIKAELEILKGASLPEDRSSDPLLRRTKGNLAEAIRADTDESSQEDQTLLEQAERMNQALEDRQDFANALWQYFANLEEKIKQYSEALDSTDKAFALSDQARSALVNEEKRKYACARELQQRLAERRIGYSQVPFDLSKALTREMITQVQSDRNERARAFAKVRKSHQDERGKLQVIAEFGEWAKIRSEFADRKVPLITRPVQRLESASMQLVDLAHVDRKLLEYNAKKQREADDDGWESLLASVSRVKKRQIFDESLDTFYLTIARIDRQLQDYAQASEAYLKLIELCNVERTRLVDAPEKLRDGLLPRILSYQTARHLAAVAASPSSQLTIEDAFKQTFGSPLPLIEQTSGWDKDFWANRLFAAEARLWGHRSWIQDVRNLLSKLGLDAEIAQYEQQQAKIASKIRGLTGLRENHSNSIAAVRADYSKAIYQAAMRTLFSLLLIPLLAWIVVRIVNHFAGRIEERVVDGLARDRISYHERMKTLSSVTRKTVAVVVWVIAALYLLHELGTPVSTILASAGVMGLAFAFGAQSLIRDFFHGFFILLENQYTIGDWIKVGDIEGTVERLTLRVTVLRDMEGTLHFIPNGAVASVSNMTHGWSQVKMEIGVGYDEDIERVSQVILEAATKVCQSPEWKDKVLADPIVPGLQSFGDSSLNIRLVVKTQPGVQWGLARALRKRIKERFDEEGIEIPFPQRVIHHVHAGNSTTSQENAIQEGG